MQIKNAGRWLIIAGSVAASVGVGWVLFPILGANNDPTKDVPSYIALPETPKSTPAPTAEDIRQIARQKAEANLRWADAKSAEILDLSLAVVDAFFQEAERRVPDFAEAALSFDSKWRLAMDQIPFLGADRHGPFLRAEFEKRVFSVDQLAAEVRNAVTIYLECVRDVENRMLLALKADVDDIPQSKELFTVDLERVRAGIDHAIKDSAGQVNAELRVDLVRNIAVLVTADVLIQLAIAGGASAALLEGGIASAGATFGVGLAIAISLDQVFTWAWDAWADPKGKLVEELNKKLADLRRSVVEGEGGLRKRFNELSKTHAAARRRLVLNEIGGTAP